MASPCRIGTIKYGSQHLMLIDRTKSAELALGNHDVILPEITGSGEQILELANVPLKGKGRPWRNTRMLRKCKGSNNHSE
jgi:hypothetical protein